MVFFYNLCLGELESMSIGLKKINSYKYFHFNLVRGSSGGSQGPLQKE